MIFYKNDKNRTIKEYSVKYIGNYNSMSGNFNPIASCAIVKFDNNEQNKEYEY